MYGLFAILYTDLSLHNIKGLTLLFVDVLWGSFACKKILQQRVCTAGLLSLSLNGHLISRYPGSSALSWTKCDGPSFK